MVALVGRLRPVLEFFSEGHVKKGHIFKFMTVDKKSVYFDQFWLRNLMVLFVFA